MSETAFGHVEALFLVLGLLFIGSVWFVVFRPSARARMRDHAMIPFRQDEPGSERDGEA